MSDERPKKTDLMAWMDPEGDDFCGSGMSMAEWLMANGIADFKASWSQQMQPERKRRLQFVIDMSIEKDKIERTHGWEYKGERCIAGGAYLEMAIEAVIAGNTKDLRSAQKMCGPEFLLWNNGEKEGQKMVEWFAHFHELCQQCLDSWPSEGKAQA